MNRNLFQYAGYWLPYCVLICLSYSAAAQSPESLMAEGNKAYAAANFSEAQRLYESALSQSATHQFPEWQFNLGNALYQQQKFTEALLQFNQLSAASVSGGLKAASYYNAGNCYLQQKNYMAAITAYKNTLRLNPLDEDARYNLTLVTALMQTDAPSSTTAVARPKTSLQPPPASLSHEEQRRLLDQLNDAEHKTLQQRPKKLQQQKKNLKDW